MNDDELTAEQQARDLLKQMGIEDWLSSGDADQDQIQELPAGVLLPLANLIEENERLRQELDGADRIANDWAKQNVELRRLLRLFFVKSKTAAVGFGGPPVAGKDYEGYADVMKRTEELLDSLRELMGNHD